jgi:hypothetical protein
MTKLFRTLSNLPRRLRALRQDKSGVMLIEFAYTVPIVLVAVMSGTELTNYATSKMSIAQTAQQMADNAARMGKDFGGSTKVVTENEINDVLTGGGLQFSTNNLLYNSGKVFLSSIEADPVNAGMAKIGWQRCRGSKTVASSHGIQGSNNLDGVGPTGRKVYAPTGGAIMFVEIVYDYQPFFLDGFIDSVTLTATAAMTVREDRNLTTINNTAAVTASTCSA